MIAKESVVIKDISQGSQPVLIISQAPEAILAQIITIIGVHEEAITMFSASEGIEVLRSTVTDLYSKPLSSKYKLFYVLNADSLSDDQANTMLKLFEEPPVYLRIVLFAQNQSKVLPTIRSRSKKYVLSSSDKIYDGELTFSQLLNSSFCEYSTAVNKLEREGFTNVLLQGIEESRKNLLNEKDLEKYKLMASSLSRITGTNVNYRLLAEEIYLFCNK